MRMETAAGPLARGRPALVSRSLARESAPSHARAILATPFLPWRPRLSRSALLLALMLVTMSSTDATADTCVADSLSWMAGSWSATRNGIREEEHWMAPRAGVLVGMNRIASDAKLRGFEYFRIETRADGVYYVSSPGGQPPTPFKLKECGPGRVVFENPTHDFPQRVIYRRAHADTLHARIEGMLKGTLRSSEWTWTRGALAP